MTATTVTTVIDVISMTGMMTVMNVTIDMIGELATVPAMTHVM